MGLEGRWEGGGTRVSPGEQEIPWLGRVRGALVEQACGTAAARHVWQRACARPLLPRGAARAINRAETARRLPHRGERCAAHRMRPTESISSMKMMAGAAARACGWHAIAARGRGVCGSRARPSAWRHPRTSELQAPSRPLCLDRPCRAGPGPPGSVAGPPSRPTGRRPSTHLGKQVAHAGRAHAHKHLHEFRGVEGDEGGPRLARHRAAGRGRERGSRG